METDVVGASPGMSRSEAAMVFHTRSAAHEFDDDFFRRRVVDEVRGAGREPVRPAAAHADEIAGTHLRQLHLAAEGIERRAQRSHQSIRPRCALLRVASGLDDAALTRSPHALANEPRRPAFRTASTWSTIR